MNMYLQEPKRSRIDQRTCGAQQNKVVTQQNKVENNDNIASKGQPTHGKVKKLRAELTETHFIKQT